MSYGKLTDWQRTYAPKDHRVNAKFKTDSLKGAAQAYHNPNRSVYTMISPDSMAVADMLISTEGDVSATSGATLRAFKNGVAGAYLMVAPQTKALAPPTTRTTAPTMLHNGTTYHLLGSVQDKMAYATLDRTAIGNLSSGANFTTSQLDAYENAMKKGIIAGKSTGSEGVKYEQGAWLIKLTIATAGASGLDNVISPMATVLSSGNNLFLTFDQLTNRH